MKTKISCREAEILMTEREWLEPDRKAELESHVAACVFCRERTGVVEDMGEYFRKERMEGLEGMKGIADNVMAVVGQGRRSAVRPVSVPPYLIMGLLAGAVVVQIMIVVYMATGVNIPLGVVGPVISYLSEYWIGLRGDISGMFSTCSRYASVSHPDSVIRIMNIVLLGLIIVAFINMAVCFINPRGAPRK